MVETQPLYTQIVIYFLYNNKGFMMGKILYEFELQVCSTSGRLNTQHTLMTRWKQPIAKLLNMKIGDTLNAEVIEEKGQRSVKIFLRD